MTTQPLKATTLGSARIGPRRELKRATESYWAGRISRAELEDVAAGLRRDNWTALAAAGLDSVPVNTFSYYDQVLDTAVLLGALPPRVAGIADDLDRYFAAARGNADVTPLEMTKWFDTNYHYLVPEIGPDTKFELNAAKLFGELKEAQALGIPARPVVVGPVTFLALSKPIDGAAAPIERLDEVVALYEQLLVQLAEAGVAWVQIDEPVLVTDILPNGPELAERVYGRLGTVADRPAILVATYFGDLGVALPALARTPVEAIAVDLVYGSVSTVTAVPELSGKTVVAGVVDGRNIWRTNLESALGSLATLAESAGAVAVSTSCSTLHVPYSLEPETELDDQLRSWLSFAEEKVEEVVVLARALSEGRDAVAAEVAASNAAAESRRTDPRLNNGQIRARLDEILVDGVSRGDAAERRRRQDERLRLPALPTTTIGSFPQTVEIRKARQALTRGEIDDAEYVRKMRAEVSDVIALQEKLGLDVLVHGEPERNDMVQYFAEQLDGFFATQNGWVQSYGSRCVRPPILYGDVARRKPMTVEWATYAQSLTQKHVKGMLTGPVTILAWSFVRDDQPLGDTANQIALAIRDETVDLQNAGIAIIQVDEPALRELLPLRNSEKQAYLDWAVGAFRLSTSGVSDATQIHTHLCYSEFGEVIGAIADLDADVTSIEAARSHMEVLDDLNAIGFSNSVGPGVYDIHSPRVPSTEEMATSLREALKAVPAQRLWVNPDCGLKTRKVDEVTSSLANLVAAAALVRADA
ncbi:5-methyltetrahydropteroyltriglutamate--homocysteine S-methyltransferase [Mycobacteroides abscessus subsp. bolletii]|uniref:5-methyltetrahydropteroyltriglutamate--homocysteine methyltransferase n=1 Tax=Mycobacteroides abscessus subsp. bolletii TaxID=319705 RepID=A0A9Q7SGL0_9MYCO|nr:5-methyltetrahydropteroyltriglutamate--homocysteine S-methyltransferase [Mycobacteroides abscessus]SHU55700.1 5-methyltetrahydropteroyltriglutamate--homocysteine S-methyltransferase [Mycobacteroides abscessus subsp. bolletii]SHU76144.1 5-methyltetrahydropteroyltriglutamate--homocysteine S-methyltransferase [Mycobacteroides abscessus subsp. bolletii]SHX65154.1 5-methyltetrahydropteroyltriglutamate--homocysteine S-methyltransferase [Mycobacteroides abscessus subsp. bolletii]SIJ27145.1 5-methyl